MKVFNYFHNSYTESILEYPIVRLTSAIVVESIQIVAAGFFLNQLSQSILISTQIKVASQSLYENVVIIPIQEEIVCRFFLLNVLRLFQEMIAQEEQELEDWKTFRVHFSALFFASLHFNKFSRSSLPYAALQFLWFYCSGMNYAYLEEKYETAAIGVVFHGVNNLLAVIGPHYPQSIPLILVAMIVNQLSAYILSR